MLELKPILMDGAVALGLLGALAVVYGLDRSPPEATASDTAPLVVEQRSEPLPDVEPLRLAVTPRQYDDMGLLLRQLGSGYAYDTIRLEDFEDYSRIADYDVIFATCGTIPDAWAAPGDLGAGDRAGVVRVRLREEVAERVRDALRRWVREGGTLYASDWRIGLIDMAFPELLDTRAIDRAPAQTLTAEVVDAGLADVIGPELSLTFDEGGWHPAEAIDHPDRVVYLQGRYRTDRRGTRTSPLLVKVPYGEGTVIFTSFHNEKQNSEQELALLRYLVFAAVTAREVTRVNESLVQGGFSPRKQNLLSASPESPSVRQSYRHEAIGPLRFVLAFGGGGARLRLDVEGPGGLRQSRTGTSELTIEIAEAPAGDWTYTITAEEVPYENYPFSLTIGSR